MFKYSLLQQRRRLYSSIVADATNQPKNVPLMAPAPTFATASASAGLRLAALDTHAPTSSLALVIPAGARYESPDQQGASNYLANYAFQYTSNSTPLRMAREIEIRGMRVKTYAAREFMVYRAQFLRDDLSFILSLLYDVVHNTMYHPWEFQLVDELTRAQATRALSNPATIGFELAHRLAFRQGLGNSTFAPKYPNVTNDSVVQYARSHLNIGSKSALFGVGVCPDELNELCSGLFNTKPHTNVPDAKTTYYGGETRVDIPSGHNVTVAFPGAALGTKENDVLDVLSAYLGNGTTYVKWGSDPSPALLSASKSTNTLVKSFNTAYSDAGLFGISATCATSPENVSKAMTQAMAVLKKVAAGDATDGLSRAIAQAKTNVLFASESSDEYACASAMQLAVLGKFVSSKDMTDRFDKVSASDLATAAKSLLSAKPSIVAAGDPVKLPYPDTLGL